MKYYYDTEAESYISSVDIFVTFCELKAENPDDIGLESYTDYLNHCMSSNGGSLQDLETRASVLRSLIGSYEYMEEAESEIKPLLDELEYLWTL